MSAGSGKEKRAVSSWEAQQVAEWLAEINPVLSKYQDSFLQLGVDGDMLLGLDESLLNELKVDSSLHRIKILKSIADLKNGSSTQAASFSSPGSKHKLEAREEEKETKRQKGTEIMNMHSAPLDQPDLRESILSFLPLRERLRVQLVNKVWAITAQSLPRVLTNTNKFPPCKAGDIVPTEIFQQWCVRFGPHFHEVYYFSSAARFGQKPKEPPCALSSVVHCTNLRKLCVSQESYGYPEGPDFVKLPSIKEAKKLGFEDEEDDEDERELKEYHLERVEGPELFSSLVEKWRGRPCTLTQLHVARYPSAWTSAFMQFMREVRPPLTHLTLNDSFVSQDNVEELVSLLCANSGPRLVSFKTDAYVKKPDLLKPLVQACPNLEELWIIRMLADQTPLLELPHLCSCKIALFNQPQDVVRKLQTHVNSTHSLFATPRVWKTTKGDATLQGSMDQDGFDDCSANAFPLFISNRYFDDGYRGEGLHWPRFENTSECTFNLEVPAGTKQCQVKAFLVKCGLDYGMP